MADALILVPSSELTRGTIESSRGRTPLLDLSSFTSLPLPSVSSDTTSTSASSITVAGPYMSSISNTV